MNPDQLWPAIDTQRLRTIDLLDDLATAEWDTPSLCEGWTGRDVAAHLTLQPRPVAADSPAARRGRPTELPHTTEERA